MELRFFSLNPPKKAAEYPVNTETKAQPAMDVTGGLNALGFLPPVNPSLNTGVDSGCRQDHQCWGCGLSQSEQGQWQTLSSALPRPRETVAQLEKALKSN